MQGAFDSTCDLYYGPSSPYGPPGVQYAAAVPCRKVPQTEILQGDFPLDLCFDWMTVQAVTPNTPKYESYAVGEWHALIATADQVAIPSGTPPQWYAIRVEDVHPFGRPSYHRVMLLPISSVVPASWLPLSPPPPPPPGPPGPPPAAGTSCAGASVLTDRVVSSYTIPSVSPDGWVKFDATPSFGVNISTAGFEYGPEYEIFQGNDCTDKVSGGTFNFDGSFFWNFGPGPVFWLRIHNPNPAPVVVAVMPYL